MDNQQRYILKKQVAISGLLGDGHIKENNLSHSMMFSSIHLEYLAYKANLFGSSQPIKTRMNQGYKQSNIYTLHLLNDQVFTEIVNNSLEKNLEELNSLGIALWFYDDGSLHKKKHFYNLNTHAFSEEINKTLFIPCLNKFGINPKIRKDRKKDGREFTYLSIGRYDGAIEVTKILRQYFVPCFEYKMWCSETIQEWSKLQAELKSEGRILSPRAFSNEIKRRQDIVRSV